MDFAKTRLRLVVGGVGLTTHVYHGVSPYRHSPGAIRLDSQNMRCLDGCFPDWSVFCNRVKFQVDHGFNSSFFKAMQKAPSFSTISSSKKSPPWSAKKPVSSLKKLASCKKKPAVCLKKPSSALFTMKTRIFVVDASHLSLDLRCCTLA